MARTARAMVGGYCYHVLNRANKKARIFHNDGDYRSFLSLLAEAQDRLAVPILAACIMPNHIHLVLRPDGDKDVSQWMQWLTTTHVRRYHRKYATLGRLWQGRFKASVIQRDHHLTTVMRYVERNSRRAELCERAETWPWGSLHWRLHDSPPFALTPSPVPLPSYWTDFVNMPQTDEELAEIRTAVNRQRPFGAREWVQRTAEELGLEQSLAPRGRPRKTPLISVE